MKLFLPGPVVLVFALTAVLVLLELTALTFGSAVLLGLALVLVLLFAVADVFRALTFRFLVPAWTSLWFYLKMRMVSCYDCSSD